MQLADILSPFYMLYYAILKATSPTFKYCLSEPRILFQPQRLSRLFFNHAWGFFSAQINEGRDEVKADLIEDAYGVVVDIGAGTFYHPCASSQEANGVGFGHTLDYLDHKNVEVYIALEPNEHMRPHITQRAEKYGFTEKPKSEKRCIILSEGAEDIIGICAALRKHGVDQVDTIISVLTFCSIPSPQATLPTLVKCLLKPGGQLLFMEHVRSDHKDVAFWQCVWTPIWRKFFDGCRLAVPTHKIIASVKNDDGSEFWREGKSWGLPGDDPKKNLFWHQLGKYIRA